MIQFYQNSGVVYHILSIRMSFSCVPGPLTRAIQVPESKVQVRTLPLSALIKIFFDCGAMELLIFVVCGVAVGQSTPFVNPWVGLTLANKSGS